jgi:AcrR family transcriptional regulator
MSKGDLTRSRIVEHAAGLASQFGLEGLSIGNLAEDLEISKSGVFAHFHSKESLQVQVVEFAGARFVDNVVRPALAMPRGEPRLRGLFDRWLQWPRASRMDGGCFFIAAAAELDDRPGPARDVLVRLQKDWLDIIANVVRTAISEKHFADDVDPEQFAYELYGLMLAYHHAIRLLNDPQADARAQRGFEGLVARARRR